MTAQEIHYGGWPARRSESAPAARRERTERRFALWRWSPRALEHRGARVGREQERAYSDLQAVAAAAEWRR